MTRNRGSLFIISGPSGVGKDTILDKINFGEKIWKSVSYATRGPRPNETDGIDYNFIEKEKFIEILQSGGMLEYTEYVDNFYGTPVEPVEQRLSAGIDVLLEIETDGMRQVKKIYPEAVSVFIMPPSFKELEKRIVNRKLDSKDIIGKRLERAAVELKSAVEYDFIVINADLRKAVDELNNIMCASGKRTRVNMDYIKKITDEVENYVISGSSADGR